MTCMKHLLIAFCFLFSLCALGQQKGWLTDYEKSGGKETPRYAETMAFCERMAANSREITITSFGKSAQERLLPLVIVDQNRLTTPEEIRKSGKIVVLIQACIHSGECEGKDAGLMLIRDIVIEKKYPGLLDHLSILFIPIFNVDGHERFGPYNRINQNGPKEMGWRVTANNLNLNRDHLKAETPEMKAWLALFNEWLPEFFIDTHTTDGADYQYMLTYLMEVFGGMDPGLTDWCKTTFLPAMTASMERSGFPVFPYIEFRNWHNPRSGLESNPAPPMLSQGYTSLRNRPGLLIETHMLKPYDQRVASTYQCLLSSLKILGKEYTRLRERVNQADVHTASPSFRSEKFPLQFETSTTDSTMVTFKGIKYEVVKSEITGEEWFRYGTEKVNMELPYFAMNSPSLTTRLPEAYIIPVEWNAIIEKLKIHGVNMYRLQKDTLLLISTYRMGNPKWNPQSYEGRHALYQFEATDITEQRLFKAGSMVVNMNQQQARIIAHLLEPKGNGSLLYWGYFDATLEQKEYGEHYVVEAMIPKMMEENPGLREEFETKKRNDPAFAKNPNQVLNWFYSKTPYWDSRKDIYPIGKIFDAKWVNQFK
jgi:hypothetical protein